MDLEPGPFARKDEWRLNQGAWTTCGREPRFGLELARARAERALQDMPFDAFEVHWRVVEWLLAAGTVDALDLAAMVAQLMAVQYEATEEGRRRREISAYVPPDYLDASGTQCESWIVRRPHDPAQASRQIWQPVMAEMEIPGMGWPLDRQGALVLINQLRAGLLLERVDMDDKQLVAALRGLMNGIASVLGESAADRRWLAN
jgi:hypothetical protein